MITFREYQTGTGETAIYPQEKALEYLALGLASEAGEVAGKVKKIVRNDKMIGDDAIVAELGDCLWYISEMCSLFGVHIENVAGENLSKLRDRKVRGKIQGDGDKR